MAHLKSAQHHWWPESVSRLWADQDGKIGWVKPDGSVKRIPPHRLGRIGNAHHIALGEPGEVTGWDTDFEHMFNKADNDFPEVISWLESLDRKSRASLDARSNFHGQPASDEQLRSLTECVISLVVRSPRNREAWAHFGERFNGPMMTARQRNAVIGANMMHSQRVISDSIGPNAKFAVLFSPGKEFVFGDGFFHNLNATVNRPHLPKVLVPITPKTGVIVVRPMSYMVEPRLSTLVLTDEEVDLCNDAVQIYSARALFFRSQAPVLGEPFRSGKHLTYDYPDNPIDCLIREIPGIPPIDRSLDQLFDL